MNLQLNLSGRRKVELVRQSEGAECGIACLAMIASYHGYRTDLSTMRRRFSVSMKGMTLKTVINIGAAIKLSSRPIRCEPNELSRLSLPVILHWGGNHFVVLERVNRGRFTVLDPALGQLTLRLSQISAKFTGIALEMTPAPDFKPQRERNPLKLASLLRLPPDVTRALLQSLGLSIIIELLMLSSPFYVQMVIDDAVVRGDTSFLLILALAFGVILVFRTLSVALRGFTLQFVSQTLSFDMQARVYHHLLRLPLEWFHKRHVGDIQSRFGSIEDIQTFISNGAISGLLDGVLGLLVLIIMYMYSTTLSSLVLASVLLYLAIRIGTIHIQRRLAGDLVVTKAAEQTRFLESLRAIETVKAAAAEVSREGQQRNAIAASVNSMVRAGSLKISSNGVAALLDGITEILVIYLGAIAVMHSSLTVGMLTAFLAYKQQFGSRLTNLIDTFINWRMLNVNLERLSDIALAKSEPQIDGGGHEGSIIGAIACRNLSFTYGFGEAPVLRGIDINIAPGDFVAIVGASGCGKSTLLKLLVGLYKPTGGEVLIDGRSLATWNVRAVRRQIAIVSQDDNLLAGSISENIAIFDENIDMDQVIACAKIAQIHPEIVAMPMGYETLVGDMGSSLSGGQKQRVMIARALYRRPRILILDEGTSHLDSTNERAVNAALADIEITRVVVAHRAETIAAASRRFILSDGRITSMRPAPYASNNEAPNSLDSLTRNLSTTPMN